MIEIQRIDQDFDRFEPLLTLIRTAFAYMDGIIDPPSSAHLLTVSGLQQKAKEEIAFIALENRELLGCVFCKPEENCLYIGKLAVAPIAQGRGVGVALLRKAEAAARERGLAALRLETRIELAENHKRFSAWGFLRTAENAHPGYTRTTSVEMTKRLSDV